MDQLLDPAPAFVHTIDVRYGECDQQAVVFNANYLAYVDDALDHWLREQFDDPGTHSWDLMVKTAQLVWHGSARWPDRLRIACGVVRWGRTSLEVVYRMAVGDRVVADARLVYVSIDTSTQRAVVLQPEVAAGFGDLVRVPDAAGEQLVD